MRSLKLFTLVCLGALIATDDASALGRRRKKKDCDGQVAMPVAYGGSACGGCGGYASSGWAGGAYAADSGWTSGSYATGSGWADTGSFAQPMPSSGAVVQGYTADAVPTTATSTSFYHGASGNVAYPGTTYPYHGATYFPSSGYQQGTGTWGGYYPSGAMYRSGAGMGYGAGNWGMNPASWGTGMMNPGGFGGGRIWRR